MTDFFDEFPEFKLLPVGQRAFEALCAMDPATNARFELRAASVAEHRILTLYPLNFFDLAPALRTYLLDQDLSHLFKFSEQLRMMNNLAESLAERDLDPELGLRWRADNPMERAATAKQVELENTLYEKLGADDRARGLSYRFVTTLWNGWWFTHNQHLLRGEGLGVNRIINAIGTTYLPALTKNA